MKYKNQLGACFAILIFCCVAMLFSCAGCGGVKESKSTNVSILDTSTKETKEQIKSTNKTTISKVKQRLGNRNTTNNPYTIEVAKQQYGEDFLDNHYFKQSPLQNINLMGDKRKATFLGSAVDNKSNVPTVFFKYNLYDQVLNELDLNTLNPYYKYITNDTSYSHVSQSGGFHLRDHKIENMPPKLKTFLGQYEDMYSTRINTRFRNQHDKQLLLYYEYTLHPPAEITEFEPMPGVSTIEVFNGEWKSIGTLKDLPFVVDNFNVTNDNEYVVLIHKAPIDEDYEPHRYKHYFSIYHLKSGKLCYRESNYNSQYSSAANDRKKSYSISIDIGDFISKDSTIWHKYNVLNKGVLTHYEYLNIFNDRMKVEGVTDLGLLLNDGSVLNKEISFESTQLNCVK